MRPLTRNRISSALLDTLRERTNLPSLIGMAVKLKRSGNAFTGLCPFHAEHNPSFAVYRTGYHCFGCGAHGDAIAWIQHCANCSFQEAVNTLADQCGIELPFPRSDVFDLPDFAPPPEVAVGIVADVDAMQRNQDLAQKLWSDAVPMAGTAAEAYLASRCIWLTRESSRLRYHGACPRGSERLPAMLGLMVNPISLEPCGIHRTYLRPDGSGKADGQSKMMLGRAGVIRFENDDDPGEALGIAEGIETALAVQQHRCNIPMLACASAGGIETLPIRPEVRLLRIFADNDENNRGLDAARTCGRRWNEGGADVRISLPRFHKDWNDVITQEKQW